jgi:hypothetical protein
MGSDPRPLRLPGPARWVGVGHARDRDPVVAAETAAARALAAGGDPRLLLVFAAAGYDLPTLATALAHAAPGIPLVGCTTAGELTPDGPAHDTLVVVAFGGPGFSVSTTEVAGAAADLRGAGIEAAAALGDVAHRRHRLLLLLADGLAGDQLELVRGAYSIAGAGVPLVGACAGDSLRRRSSGQLHGGRALTGAVVAAAIGSDAPFGVGVGHGWRVDGEPVHVTGATGAEVLTLDGRPALDVYLERAGAPAQAREDAEAFARFAHDHPLGLRRHAGEPHVRLVVGADLRRRALRTVAEVPQGGLAWLMTCDPDTAGAAGFAAVAEAISALDGGRPLGVLAFGSAARPSAAPDRYPVARYLSGVPLAGFYGYGEFARARGVTGFHNHALAVLAVG